MKVQFTARSLLLLTAAAGTWFGAAAYAGRMLKIFFIYESTKDLAGFAIASSSWWLPLVVLAYALGRWQFTKWTLAAMLIAEAMGICGIAIAHRYFFS